MNSMDAVIATPDLPGNATVQRVRFVRTVDSQSAVLFPLPAAIGRTAVLLPENNGAPANSSAAEGPVFELLRVPMSPEQLPPHDVDPETLHAVQEWVDSSPVGNGHVHGAAPVPPQFMTFQGVHIAWQGERYAVLARAETLDAAVRAAMEVAFYQSELAVIEQEISGHWGELEGDIPLACQFDESTLPRKAELGKRFGRVMEQRARLARIGPFVRLPHVYPPTLASQIGERLRERTRMEERYEFVDEQIEVFEQVYEQCNERANQYALTRSGNILEWIIIILLLTQILLTAVEILSTTGT